jgi:thiopurine S-methyltransferase
LGPETLGTFDLIWDRAALVALDPERRKRYAKVLQKLLKPGGHLLINSFEYDQSEMAGPPHSVPPEELRDLYPGWEWKPLRLGDWQTEGKFRARGVSQFRAYLGVLKA